MRRWPRQRVEVDVSTGQHDADAAAGEALARAEHGRERDRRGRFDHELEPLPQEPHRRDRVRVVDGQDRDRVTLHQSQVDRAEQSTQAIADGAWFEFGDAFAAAQRGERICGAGRFRPDHRDARRDRMRRDRAAAHEPAAADRRDEQVERTGLAQQFERCGALPCDHARIRIRMHELGAGFGAYRFCRGFARGQRRSAAMQGRATGFDRRELGTHRAFGHDHVRGNAARACGQRERGAMVARRMRDDAARGGGGVERPHRIAGAAELERARALQVLALEVEFRARKRIERARTQHRRRMRMGRDARGGGLNRGEIGIGSHGGTGGLERECRANPPARGALAIAPVRARQSETPIRQVPMSDAFATRPEQRLADYRAPAWRVREIALEFDLDRGATQVDSTLQLECDEPGESLRLDAVDLELLAIEVDGRALAAGEYQVEADAILVHGLPARASLRTRVRIAPARNTALQGLYASGAPDAGFLLTQCEAEGFRRITPFPDRPDVLARYEVTLRAERARYPLLLANGNPDGAGELAHGRHWARFVDPHPKPCYLFALVAGRLETLEDAFTTAEGRRVRLCIHSEADSIGRCGWAMECLKQAMRWDERRFGRCYDLDVFHVVATHDFTMGAMENKGLNIFNARYLLADPDSATDDDYRHVLAVVGHEYFHNWSGNRVTCRDWFQLCLKEGLTVYREQEFESDLASRTLRRIEDVRLLWRTQFAEDAGPLAHPVRPDRYSEISNFYTATVYEKGAEIVRMLASVLGEDGFRRGLDLYFERHDGQAATVEQFLAALGDANHIDLSRWLAWYAQAGTPVLVARGRHDPARRCFELSLEQSTPPTPAQPHAVALPIPVAIALFDVDGQALPLRLAGESGVAPVRRTLLLDSTRAHWRFEGIDAPPSASLLRGYSAPVRLVQALDADRLARLARDDDDGFNRWFAADTLARRLFAQALAGAPESSELDALADAVRAAVDDTSIDPALAAELLTLPDASALAEGLADIDPEAVHRARARIEQALAQALEASLRARHAALSDVDPRATDAATRAARRLRNACLAALCRVDPDAGTLARAQLARAMNLGDRLAALRALLECGEGAEAELAQFAHAHAHEPLLLDKWFMLQATDPHPHALERVQVLVAHARFQWRNPNNVHALVGAFAMRNPRAFHRADGQGYRFVADALLRIDALTPQVAARIATSFSGWRRFESGRRALMRAELERLAASPALSPDLADILARCLSGMDAED